MTVIRYDPPSEDTICADGSPELAAFQVGRSSDTGLPVMLRLTVRKVRFDIRLDDIERLCYEPEK